MHRLFQRALAPVLMLYLILGCYKGYIALFDEESCEPRQIFPNQVITLPEEDQKLLAEGIVIRSDRQLKELLEDYLS